MLPSSAANPKDLSGQARWLPGWQAFLLIGALLPVVSAFSADRIRSCDITTTRSNETETVHQCVVSRHSRGGVSLARKNSVYLYDEVADIKIWRVKGNRYEVSSLFISKDRWAIQSRWGPATRVDQEGRQCWVGDDFSICIY